MGGGGEGMVREIIDRRGGGNHRGEENVLFSAPIYEGQGVVRGVVRLDAHPIILYNSQVLPMGSNQWLLCCTL